MKLNLPDVDVLRDPYKILMVGVGGGYDFLGTHPLAHTYRKMCAMVYGYCSLTPDMEYFEHYNNEAEKTWNDKRKSHIHTRVISAVFGEFDDQKLYEDVGVNVYNESGEKTFANPLMGMYWLFDLMKVYQRSLVAKHMIPTTTGTDALMVYRQLLPELMKNKRQSMRLPL